MADRSVAPPNEKRGPSTPSRGRANRGNAQTARDSAQDDSVPNAAADVAIDLMLPSIMPDEFADNHAVELEICMRWFSSDAGQAAKIESPAGHANVRAHAMFHREYLLKQQRQTQQQKQV